MAAGHPGDDGAGEDPITIHRLTRCHCRQGAAAGHTQVMHGLAEDVFPQHRAQGCPTITHARVGSLARPLQLQVVS